MARKSKPAPIGVPHPRASKEEHAQIVKSCACSAKLSRRERCTKRLMRCEAAIECARDLIRRREVAKEKERNAKLETIRYQLDRWREKVARVRARMARHAELAYSEIQHLTATDRDLGKEYKEIRSNFRKLGHHIPREASNA